MAAIDELRRLTNQVKENIQPLSAFMQTERRPGFVEIETVKGKAFTQGLYNRPGQGAVARTWVSIDTEFHAHAHDQIEYLVILKGTLHVEIEGVVEAITEGGFVAIPAGAVHRAWCNGMVELFAIGPKGGEDWPDA